MFKKSLLLITIILSVNAEEPNCDHIGPRPIGYCGINIMTRCVENQENDEWFIEMIEYNDSNCNGTIIKQHQFPCLESQNCECGMGICDKDLVITIKHDQLQNPTTIIKEEDDDKQNEEFESYLPQSTIFDDEFECDSLNFTFKPIVFIKNQCISGRFISYTLDEPEDDLKAVILKCDKDKQILSYYEYDNDECLGDPVFEEAEILIDVIDLPCVTINC